MAQIDEILAPGQSVNKQLLRQYLAAREYARPEDYGAIGDGVHDDTDAINQALNEAKSVQLRACTYRITAPIVLKYGYALLGMGEATVILAREVPYSFSYLQYPSDFNAIEFVNSFSLLQNMRIVGGGTGIKLYGRDGPCVKNVIENVTIYDAKIGLIFDGWRDTNRPCYWNNVSRVLIARPKTDGVLFTVTPANWNDPSTYGDTPNANKLHDVRVYSLSAPMTGFGFNVASGQFGNSIFDCEANVHPTAQACLRLGFNAHNNFITNFYAESHGAVPGIRIDNGSRDNQITNLFSATGGSAIWDPTLQGEFTSLNAGYPYKNFLKETWIKSLFLEGLKLGTVFINPGADEPHEIDIDVKQTLYLVSAFSGEVTINLPNANDAQGCHVTIKKTDLRQNPVFVKEIDGSGPDSRTVRLQNRFDYVTMTSNGAQWWIVTESNPPKPSLYVQYTDTDSGVFLPNVWHELYLVSAFGGEIEFRLPLPNAAPGRRATIKKIDPSANKVKVTKVGGGGPDAQQQNLNSHFSAITVFSDGGQWVVLSRY